MTDKQDRNREEYFRRYCKSFIAINNFNSFHTLVYVNGERFSVDIKKEASRFQEVDNNADNGFIQ